MHFVIALYRYFPYTPYDNGKEATGYSYECSPSTYLLAHARSGSRTNSCTPSNEEVRIQSDASISGKEVHIQMLQEEKVRASQVCDFGTHCTFRVPQPLEASPSFSPPMFPTGPSSGCDLSAFSEEVGPRQRIEDEAESEWSERKHWRTAMDGTPLTPGIGHATLEQQSAMGPDPCPLKRQADP